MSWAIGNMSNCGGVRFADGTPYNTIGRWAVTAATSPALALSWQLPTTGIGNKLLNPSTICNRSSACTPGPNTVTSFGCNGTRRKLQTVIPGCSKSCEDLPSPIDVGNCKRDVTLTSDTSWACQKSYENPVIQEVSPCSFDKLDDKECNRDGKDKCGKMGGQCIVDCEGNLLDGHICLPGICSSKSGVGSTRRLTNKGNKKKKETNETTEPKEPKKPKRAPKTNKKPKGPKGTPSPEPVECMCMASLVYPAISPSAEQPCPHALVLESAAKTNPLLHFLERRCSIEEPTIITTITDRNLLQTTEASTHWFFLPALRKMQDRNCFQCDN